MPLYEQNPGPGDTADRKKALELGVDLGPHEAGVRAGSPLHGATDFFGPDGDTGAEALPSCPAPGETPRSAPGLPTEWLAQRLTATFGCCRQPGA